MAFGVRITGLPARDDKSLWSVEAPWWREAELRADPRFKDASRSPGYADYERVRDFMGWSNKAMVERYGWDLPEAGKKRANIVQFGTKLTRGPTGKRNKNGDSVA